MLLSAGLFNTGQLLAHVTDELHIRITKQISDNRNVELVTNVT